MLSPRPRPRQPRWPPRTNVRRLRRSQVLVRSEARTRNPPPTPLVSLKMGRHLVRTSSPSLSLPSSNQEFRLVDHDGVFRVGIRTLFQVLVSPEQTIGVQGVPKNPSPGAGSSSKDLGPKRPQDDKAPLQGLPPGISAVFPTSQVGRLGVASLLTSPLISDFNSRPVPRARIGTSCDARSNRGL